MDKLIIIMAFAIALLFLFVIVLFSKIKKLKVHSNKLTSRIDYLYSTIQDNTSWISYLNNIVSNNKELPSNDNVDNTKFASRIDYLYTLIERSSSQSSNYTELTSKDNIDNTKFASRIDYLYTLIERSSSQESNSIVNELYRLDTEIKRLSLSSDDFNRRISKLNSTADKVIDEIVDGKKISDKISMASRAKGLDGEKRVFAYLAKVIYSSNFMFSVILYQCQLPSGRIPDFILIGQYGVFVIEAKNRTKGFITGKLDSDVWMSHYTNGYDGFGNVTYSYIEKNSYKQAKAYADEIRSLIKQPASLHIDYTLLLLTSDKDKQYAYQKRKSLHFDLPDDANISFLLSDKDKDCGKNQLCNSIDQFKLHGSQTRLSQDSINRIVNTLKGNSDVYDVRDYGNAIGLIQNMNCFDENGKYIKGKTYIFK